MNERIKELAEIAEEYSYVEYAKKQTGYSRQYFYNQKFAELIVKKCAMIADYAHLGGVIEPGVMVKEYFGVEQYE